MKQQLRRAISAISPATVGAILLFVIAAMIAASLSKPVQNMFDDVMISVVSPYTDPGDEIVVIAITEETLAKLSYREPIDRGFLADLVATIDAASPRAIGIDILFDQPTEPEKDNRLARTLQGTSSPLVLASASTLDGLTKSQAQYIDDFAAKVSKGLAVLLPDPVDGVVRRFFSGRQESGVWRPGFAEAIAAAGGAHPTSAQRDLAYFHQLDALPYHFRTFPAQSIQVLPPSWLAGKFILIGADLPSKDRYVTPFAALNGISGGTLPGVVIHAHGLAQLLTSAQISRASSTLVGLITAAAGSIALWLAWRPLPILLKPLILFAAICAICSGAIFLFWQFRILMPIVWPSVLIVAAFSSLSFIAWRRDNDERRYLHRAFGQYVSPAVVESVLKDPSSLRLGGERRAIISIFTDIEGFTTLSEHQAPESTADQLNAYLDRICDLFVMYGATIDKIVGDSVVGFFGAPTFHQDQAEHAISLALDIDAWAEEYRNDLAKRDVKLGTTRIGIHGGPAIVGNFGGSRFFDYTAIGDTVNTASRLEGANRHLGTRICVSASVAKAAPSHQCRPAAVLYLRGKSRGIEVFEPLSASSPARKYQTEYVSAYQMMTAGSLGAGAAFAKLAADHPEDHLVALYHSRLSSGKVGTDISLMEK